MPAHMEISGDQEQLSTLRPTHVNTKFIGVLQNQVITS